MSGFLSIPADEIENVPEPVALHTDEEVQLRITDVKVDKNKDGYPYFLPRFAVLNHENIKTFTKYFGIPHSEMDADKRNAAIRSIKYFYQAFDIDYSSGEVELEQLVGAEGWALIGVEGNEDDEYGESNFVKRFIVPGE